MAERKPRTPEADLLALVTEAIGTAHELPTAIARAAPALKDEADLRAMLDAAVRVAALLRDMEGRLTTRTNAGAELAEEDDDG